jgi:hypothetical protein
MLGTGCVAAARTPAWLPASNTTADRQTNFRADIIVFSVRRSNRQSAENESLR